MKKISRTIVNFFKAIVRFFDKCLITPITKFFVNIIDFFNNRGSKFEKILINRQSLVIISLIFALITFYAIDQKHISLIDNSAEVLYGQKVNVNYNEELYVVEGVPKEVDVTFVGRKMDVYLAKQYPLNGVTLDLTGYTPGSYSVGFKYEQKVPSVEYKVDPSTVNIRIYDKNSVNKEVSTDIIHKDNLDSKLNIEGIVLDRDNVIVKGASHRLEEVAVVKAIIDIDKMSNIKVGTIPMYEVPLIAYDAEGHITNYAETYKRLLDNLNGLINQYNGLNANTKTVLSERTTNLDNLREYAAIGVSAKGYYALKEGISAAQIELDKNSNQGGDVQWLGLLKADMTSAEKKRVIEQSDFLTTGRKAVYDILSPYGFSMQQMYDFFEDADYRVKKETGEVVTSGKGQLDAAEAAVAISQLPGLSDNQRVAIYNAMKERMSNYFNDWKNYSYASELNYARNRSKYTYGRGTPKSYSQSSQPYNPFIRK